MLAVCHARCSKSFFIVKRLLTATAALVAFAMTSVIGGRIAVGSLFKGVASSRATGLFLQAHWDSITRVENYRAPLEANRAGEFLPLRNSLVEGVGAIFSSVSLFLGVLI